jgi:hypothetical protein
MVVSLAISYLLSIIFRDAGGPMQLFLALGLLVTPMMYLCLFFLLHPYYVAGVMTAYLLSCIVLSCSKD